MAFKRGRDFGFILRDRLRAASIMAVKSWLDRRDPRPDKDPFEWEISVLKLAAAAGSAKEAIGAVYGVTKNLDDRTLHLVLLQLAADVAHSPGLSAATVADWAEGRKFSLIVDRFDDSAE